MWTLDRVDSYAVNDFPFTFLDIDNPLLAIGHARLVLDGEYSERPTSLRIDEAAICTLSLCEREHDLRTEGSLAIATLISENYGHIFEGRLPQMFKNRPEVDLDRTCWQPG